MIKVIIQFLYVLYLSLSYVGVNAQDSTSISQVICLCEYRDSTFGDLMQDIDCLEYYLVMQELGLQVMPEMQKNALEYMTSIYNIKLYTQNFTIYNIKLAENVSGVKGIIVDRDENIYLDIRIAAGNTMFFTHILAIFNIPSKKHSLHYWYDEL